MLLLLLVLAVAMLVVTMLAGEAMPMLGTILVMTAMMTQ